MSIFFKTRVVLVTTGYGRKKQNVRFLVWSPRVDTCGRLCSFVVVTCFSNYAFISFIKLSQQKVWILPMSFIVSEFNYCSLVRLCHFRYSYKIIRKIQEWALTLAYTSLYKSILLFFGWMDGWIGSYIDR